METEESASACLELNGREVDGRHIRVDLATPTNDTHCSVFVGNVPFGADEEKLRKVFESCGPIDGIRIIKDTRTGINKGFAYVKFKDSSSVLFACKKNERIEVEGRKLRVFRCRSDKSKFQTKFGGAKSQVGRNKKLLKSFQPSKRKGKNDKKKTKMRRKEKSVKRKEKARRINK
ncbi:PREDICTED: nucleolar protein 12-like [Amphimedon queenslandica]|uniref:RRM domain-containing protein n=1 Tax=Amphimedon queenslandica TaxID=400682 RepID=A0A1X7TBG5_AMPQE|nr:PREDICTED: nucleolar protein 12-like [Amphimedon queenslandica]|eukprot:XP_003390812.2 PREDICTED: nucleolar protein 12-like [Amphimedon queenslandica]